MQDIEHPGKFYLGREHSLESGETDESKPLLYASRDLTTHAVCVGMTGSGKTGLCLSLIEEAAIDGIPVIAIDPKGDLGNLMLTFPDLLPSDFRPWIDESIAIRKGKTADAVAEGMARLWRDGLAQWGESGERIRKFKEAVDVAIYTPGSRAGLPITVLKSFSAPSSEVLDDSDAIRERVASTASGVLALLGIDADPIKSREHILISNLLDRAWREGRDLDVAGLIGEIQNPPIDQIGILDLDTFFPEKDRIALAMQLNNLLASPSFQSWMEGEPLNVQNLLWTPEGKPRISILSIAHLGDEERMFFVTILLGEILAWMRSQPGTSRLRALLYMDEIYGYFPPSANPPSKRPMLTLLKQARAFGLGVVLSTQNPVDLDYKGLSNAGTWFLGRLQTERDKMRVIEGLEGASAQAGGTFDKRKMEATLAGLGSRVFLMNNVHDDTPVVFHTRWALSYLRGPLTRDQIKTLMADHRARGLAGNEAVVPAKPQLATRDPRMLDRPPALDPDIGQRYVALKNPLPEGTRLEYGPGLYGMGAVRYTHRASGIDDRHHFSLITQIGEQVSDLVWERTEQVAPKQLQEVGESVGLFPATLPEELKHKKSYQSWATALKDRKYHGPAFVVYHCGELEDVYSKPGEPPETKDEFGARIKVLAVAQLEEKRKAIEGKYRSRLDRIRKRKWWSTLVQFIPAVFKFLVGLIAAQLGNKRARDLATSTANEIGKTGGSRRGKSRAEKDADELEKLEDAMERELAELEADLNPDALEIDDVSVRPLKKNIDIQLVGLAWLPWVVGERGRVERGW